MKLTINTKVFQDMIAKSIKGAGNNKMIPITSLMGIELKDSKLILMTTDGSNHLRVSQNIELDPVFGPANEQKFYTIVNAETLAKLVAKTTSENMTLRVTDNYLSVKGNGTYKLEIPMDEDGNIIRFPNFNINATGKTIISISLLKNILNATKVSIAKTMEVPCLTGYYLFDKAISTDREMMCCVKESLLDNPILISSEMAELLQLLEGETVVLGQEDNKLLFETDNIVIYGKQLEGLDIYPVQALDSLLNLTYDNIVRVNKQDLLNVLDRMTIFVSDYDKNGVYLSFTEDGLQLTSQKSNASEIIEMDRDANKDFVPFSCLIDITMFQSQVQINSSDIIEIHYGQEKSIKIVDGNTTMIICLLNKED